MCPKTDINFKNPKKSREKKPRFPTEFGLFFKEE